MYTDMKNTLKKLIYAVKNELPIILAAFMCALVITFIVLNAYSKKTVNSISNEVFRFHVLANSDTQEDQSLKLKVRDAVLSEMNTELEASKSKTETEAIIYNNLDRIIKCAEKTIKENGYDYTVTAEIGNEYFPEKHYGDIRLPSGNYDGLRILIGEGKGHNWWCVMYPPLCFVDTACVVKEADKTKLKENLSSDDYRLITESNNVPMTIKFKIIELFS